MFFSANGPSFRSQYPGLVRFVLNKEERYLDPSLRIYAFLTSSDRSRQTGIAGIVDFESHKVKVLSEITFPPLGFVMGVSCEPPDSRLFDISFFANYAYNDWKELSLKLPALPVYSYLPGDYRSRDQILTEMKKKSIQC